MHCVKTSFAIKQGFRQHLNRLPLKWSQSVPDPSTQIGAALHTTARHRRQNAAAVATASMNQDTLAPAGVVNSLDGQGRPRDITEEFNPVTGRSRWALRLP